jgi:putative transposase
VFGAFLYHAGLSHRRIEPFVDCWYEAIRDWFHRCKHLFESDCRQRQNVVDDETKIEIDGDEHSVCASFDCAHSKFEAWFGLFECRTQPF